MKIYYLIFFFVLLCECIRVNDFIKGNLEWELVGRTPLPQYAHGFLIVDDYLYTFGGLTGYYAPTDSLWYIALRSDTMKWNKGMNLPGPREDFVFGYWAGCIFIAGGQGPPGFFKECYCASVLSDHSIGEWRRITDLPEERDDVSGFIYNGYMYIIGGRDWEGRKNTVFYGKIEGDTIKEWLTTTPLPENLAFAATCVYDGYLYVLGGTNGYTISDDVYYAPINTDGSIGAWLATSKLPLPITGASAFAYEGYVYIVGGRSGEIYLSKIYRAKIKEDHSLEKWEEYTEMPYEAVRIRVTVWDGYLYIAGGYNNGIVYDYIYRIRLK